MFCWSVPDTGGDTVDDIPHRIPYSFYLKTRRSESGTASFLQSTGDNFAISSHILGCTGGKCVAAGYSTRSVKRLAAFNTGQLCWKYPPYHNGMSD